MKKWASSGLALIALGSPVVGTCGHTYVHAPGTHVHTPGRCRHVYMHMPHTHTHGENTYVHTQAHTWGTGEWVHTGHRTAHVSWNVNKRCKEDSCDIPRG